MKTTLLTFGTFVLSFVMFQGAVLAQNYPPSFPATRTVEVECGHFGEWRNTVMIPSGHRIVGFRVRFEESCGRGDDTTLNGIEILYRHRSLRGTVHRLMVHQGDFGEWKQDVIAPEGFEVVAMKTRLEGKCGRGDDTALNGIQVLIKNQRTNRTSDLMVEQGIWGNWLPNYKGFNDSNYYIAGIQVKAEGKCGSGDDTAMNGIRLIYRRND